MTDNSDIHRYIFIKNFPYYDRFGEWVEYADYEKLATRLQDTEQKLGDAHKHGYQEAVNDIANMMESMPVDAETIRQQFSCDDNH